MLKLDKEKFKYTELGISLCGTIKRLEYFYAEQSVLSIFDTDISLRVRNDIKSSYAQLEVFTLAIKQFYGIEYHYTRNDSYYGLVTEDGEDFLIRFLY